MLFSLGLSRCNKNIINQHTFINIDFFIYFTQSVSKESQIKSTRVDRQIFCREKSLKNRGILRVFPAFLLHLSAKRSVNPPHAIYLEFPNSSTATAGEGSGCHIIHLIFDVVCYIARQAEEPLLQSQLQQHICTQLLKHLTQKTVSYNSYQETKNNSQILFPVESKIH